MDCVAIYEDGKIQVREFRNIKQGDRIVVGRTEDCEEGIYVHADCFEREENKDTPFSFRQSRSRETAFSYDYEQLYELLEHERQYGYVVWVLGPACAFDAEARGSVFQADRGRICGCSAGRKRAGDSRSGGRSSGNRAGAGRSDPKAAFQRAL